VVCTVAVLPLHSFMQDGVAAAVLALLAHNGTTTAVQHSDAAVASTAAAAAAAAAGVLRALTTADDERPLASKAFLHARQLAGNPHNALSALLPVLQQLQSCEPLPAGHLTAVMAAVRQVRGLLEGFQCGVSWGGATLSLACTAMTASHCSPAGVSAWSRTWTTIMQLACIHPYRALLAMPCHQSQCQC
jgi:hypothetical protein